MPTAYLFEVQSIQSFIFATGKLRDASGASELVNALCGEAGQDAPQATGLAAALIGRVLGDARVYRSTGGVLDLVSDKTEAEVARFRALFRLMVMRQAPGLAFADGIGTDVAGSEEARALARADMRAAPPFPGWPGPLGSPLTRPAPRSGGLPAIRTGWTRPRTGTCVITGEFADLPTLAKRQFLSKGNRALADQFLPPGRTGQWPETFEDDREDPGQGSAAAGPVLFPFGGREVPRIALVHADGNGIGQMFMEASSRLARDQIRQLTFGLAQATREAVRTAMGLVVDEAEDDVIPARPILLGGDDLTLIVRADLALGFVRAFATAFEDRVTEAVRRFLPDHPGLTVKAGVVVLGPRQPFARALDLCEALAAGAKAADQSRIGLWRMTTSAFPESVVELEQQTAGTKDCVLWRRSLDLDELAALETLARLLRHEAVGHGALRRVPEVLKTDHGAARAIYGRALDLVQRRDPETFKALDAALLAFGPEARSLEPGCYCPLLQAHDIAQFMQAEGQP
jgi:hypothetical protein